METHQQNLTVNSIELWWGQDQRFLDLCDEHLDSEDLILLFFVQIEMVSFWIGRGSHPFLKLDTLVGMVSWCGRRRLHGNLAWMICKMKLFWPFRWGFDWKGCNGYGASEVHGRLGNIGLIRPKTVRKGGAQRHDRCVDGWWWGITNFSVFFSPSYLYSDVNLRSLHGLSVDSGSGPWVRKSCALMPF